jgi:hypothetical protein
VNKTQFAVTLMAVLMIASVARAESDFDIVVNAMPATVLIDIDGDKFSATGSDGRISLSELYTMPNIAVGIGTELEDLYVDLVGGAGIIINDGFRSFILQAILELTFEASDSLNIGPRIGLIHFEDPEWLENDDVEFDAETGLLVGVSMAMGDKIKYLVSVDIIDATFDLNTGAGVTTSESELDLTGLAIQFGVRGEF